MFKKVAGYCSGIVAMATPAFCAVDLTGFTVDSASVETMAGIVLTGLAVIWGIRKLVKTINRS